LRVGGLLAYPDGMIKKLLALVATALIALVMSFTPAQAADYNWQPLNCVEDSPGVQNASGSLVVIVTREARFDVTLNLNDAGNRNWTWKMRHDGVIPFQGTRVGDFSVTRGILDMGGTDVITGIIYNAPRTVYCSATISIP
jgi:hypothetical protein